MAIELSSKVNKLFENLATNLDISPSKYKQAVDRYSAVAKWLTTGEYEMMQGELHIYPQGSFRLGTVIRPLLNGIESDYDIDLVCKLPFDKETTTSMDIKTIIGDRLKNHVTYAEMLDKEGRRCWTLIYKEQDEVGFHLDILPSVNEDDSHIGELSIQGIPESIAKQAIAVTHKHADNEYGWSKSNPGGYAEWFESINKLAFDLIKSFQKQLIFEHNNLVFNKVEEVPDQLVKTPLQHAIQILKRHRDLRFVGHEWECDKPISMIITTLAARLYKQEKDVYTTIQHIVDGLSELMTLLNPGYILNKSFNSSEIITRSSDKKWHIPNPVNPSENFADRWHENNDTKAKAFFQWVAWVKQDIIEILNIGDFSKITKSLEGSLGKDLVTKSALGLYPIFHASLPSYSIPHVEITKANKPWCNNVE